MSAEAASFKASLEDLSRTIPSSKIFCLQISDGAHIELGNTIKQAQDNGIHLLYMWSNKHRPLPSSKWGDYLPVNDIIEAVLKTGWRGPWSYEVFFEQDMAQDDPTVPERWTKEAADCHEKIIQEMKTRIEN